MAVSVLGRETSARRTTGASARDGTAARDGTVVASRPSGRPVRGVRQVSAALAGLAASARHELLTFDDPAASAGRAIPEPFLELAGACMRTAAERAGSVRRIVPRHALPQLAGTLRAAGRARLTQSIPFKMIVVDRRVAAVPLDLELLYNGLLLIRDPVVVQALVRAHHACWDAGEELTGAVVPPRELPRQLRPVLEALLAGQTDEAAAARLGMSGRTYSRRVGELMSALGTTSRFRAGAEAARRGWL
ncbi:MULTISPECIES: helix-turn-helix transcriptional regulator [Streptomyces]|uniref:DNA-binding response regulator n=1 Tax=Streptomyces solicathayae TaxID=3081768 RepID=A0ABZ0LY00_9ACTN|nr:DNA-binding response regulator [Streptomyces sp. HUAS YS2]WOX24287.1 DNA-binding response regulator [Streptomyces sp. HUAS YS2]